jgi:hypothetical protein
MVMTLKTIHSIHYRLLIILILNYSNYKFILDVSFLCIISADNLYIIFLNYTFSFLTLHIYIYIYIKRLI